MQGGDISNEVVPRLLLVWEGLIGIPTASGKPEAPEARKGWFERWWSRTDHVVGVKDYEPNWTLATRIWDATFRLGYSVDTVTFLGKDWVEPIKEWIDEADLPIGHVTYQASPQKLASGLAFMPHIYAVYDPDPAHRLMYGGKSRTIDPDRPVLF